MESEEKLTWLSRNAEQNIRRTINGITGLREVDEGIDRVFNYELRLLSGNANRELSVEIAHLLDIPLLDAGN
eukprot:jgi/Galph1/6104/GphlegSOOS_G4762.1